MRFVLRKLIYGCLFFLFLLIISGIFKGQVWAVLVCVDDSYFTRRYCAKDALNCDYCASQAVGPYTCVKDTCVSNTAVAVGDCTLTGPSDCYTGCTPPTGTYPACAKVEVIPMLKMMFVEIIVSVERPPTETAIRATPLPRCVRVLPTAPIP